MALDWLPQYPDRVGTDTDLPATYGPYYAAAGLPGWRNWTPIVPDWVSRKTTYPQGGITEDPFPRPPLGLAEFPTVTYPDRLDPKRDLREYRFWIPYQPTIPSTLKNWAAIYPDRPVRRKINPWGHAFSFVTLTNAFALPTPMVWQGRYPSQVDRKVQPIAQKQSLALDTSRTPVVTSTSWTPVYPDQIASRTSVLAGAQQTSAQNYDPIVNPPPTNSTWPLQFPAQVWAKASLHTGAQVTFTINLEPIPNAPAPDQSWQQSLPTPPLRPVGVGSTIVRTAPLTPAILIPPASWIGSYPDAIARLTVRPSAGQHGAQFGWLQAVAEFGWRGVYPTQFPIGSPPRWLGGTTFRLDPTNLLDLATCVEWTSETFGRPVVTSEAFDRPTIPGVPDVGFLLLEDGGKILLEGGAGAEIFDRARMIEEDWC